MNIDSNAVQNWLNIGLAYLDDGIVIIVGFAVLGWVLDGLSKLLKR